MKKSERLLLAILDGWGLGQEPRADAILQADTPFFDSLMARYPHATLVTYGESVGLPEGQMGNSEVGHLNIGAGRVVYQELARINKAVRERELHQNQVLLDAMTHARTQQKPLHLFGLVSDGGVHSHINHLKALCDMAVEQGVQQTCIHAFTDGRDTDPKGGMGYLTDLLGHIEGKPVSLGSVTGRYYAMDRDKRWERVKLAYDALVKGEGEWTSDVLSTLATRYDAGETDEFIKPLLVKDSYIPIQSGDVAICFNFRTDRPREITTVLTQQNMPDYGMQKLDLYYVTMTRYDETYRNVRVVFEKDDVQNTLGEVLANLGKTQVRIAETEKYPHVTFFFSGGREAPFAGERRILIPSPKVATYDLQPEMSAYQVTDAIVGDIQQNRPDFICLNFANTDMVGHTGVFEAAMQAAEAVDKCLSKLVPTALASGYDVILIADHGNSDYMINEDGTPNTAHTMNPVPVLWVGNDPAGVQVRDGKLADLAPTILSLMGLPIPKEMDGEKIITW